ncbi:MAG: hypothetical protein ACYST2_00530 [Planctomycetota bacterium]|jgi:phage FluMu protein Com
MNGKKLITSMRGGFLSMSKPVMVIVLVACLVLAVVVYVAMLPDDQGDYTQLAGVNIWVKCNNPDCNAEYEIDKAEFRGFILEEKKQNPMFPGDPPVACNQCNQQSLLEAVQCPKCNTLFFRGELGAGHFKDECPQCGHSDTKEQRAKSAAGG